MNNTAVSSLTFLCAPYAPEFKPGKLEMLSLAQTSRLGYPDKTESFQAVTALLQSSTRANTPIPTLFTPARLNGEPRLLSSLGYNKLPQTPSQWYQKRWVGNLDFLPHQAGIGFILLTPVHTSREHLWSLDLHVHMAVTEQPSSFSENLTKHLEDFDSENHKTLMKESKEDLNKWRGIPCSSFLKLTIVKMSILSKFDTWV